MLTTPLICRAKDMLEARICWQPLICRAKDMLLASSGYRATQYTIPAECNTEVHHKRTPDFAINIVPCTVVTNSHSSMQLTLNATMVMTRRQSQNLLASVAYIKGGAATAAARLSVTTSCSKGPAVGAQDCFSKLNCVVSTGGRTVVLQSGQVSKGKS